MDKRVRILETEVAVLGQRQATIETDVAENAASVAKMDEKIDTIHARITNIDRRLSKMQGMLIASFALLQILSDILTS